MVGLLLGAIALIFLIWDTPRLLTSGYLWGGLLIGSAPVAVWYSFQGLHYGQVFFTHFFNQSWQRVWQPIDDRSSYSWYYLLEICKYAWPWLLFLPQGLKLAWENRNLGWAKLVLIWSGVYLIAISAIATQLPWYILPIYPALALIVGAKLGEVWNWPNSQSYSRVWVVGLGLLGLIGLGSSLYFGGLGPKLDWHLQLVLAFLALTYLMAAILVAQKDVQFISILLWGMYVSLLLFSISPDWIEEPTPNPIKPAAAIKDNTQPKLFLISG
jgi:4-amino-4-deoxy-L-arabinose transferase-like glycosyltransferase